MIIFIHTDFINLFIYLSSRIYLIAEIMESSSKGSNIFHSMMQSPSFIGNINLKCLTATIKVPYHRIQEQIDLYQWRGKNCNEVVSYQWLKIEPCDDKNVTFTLRIPQKLVTFDEIKIVKGTNIFKNLSKLFLSFSLLYDKFGPFEINPKMIAYDAFFEPYVWINQDYRKNQYKRDLISEHQFATNVLFIILKHDHKFQNHQILDYCCQIKGQGFNLKEMANFFNEFHEKEQLSKRSKIIKSVSPQSTLCFSKQSKIKKQRFNKDFKGLNTINGQTYKSVMKNSQKQKQKRHTFQRTASLTQIKEPTTTTNDQQCYFSTNSGSGIKINILKESDQDYSQRSRKGKDSFLPIHEELQISIDFQNEEEMDMQKQVKVIQLQQLDKFKKFLAKSIITGCKK